MRIFSNVKPEVSKKNYGSTKYKQHKKSIFVTLVKWLDEWLAPAKNLNIKRVLVLQINPFPQAPQDRGDRKVGHAGWKCGTARLK
jgi:hypothetical protein